MSGSRRKRCALLWLGVAVAASIGGCGEATDDLPRQAVSDEVRLDGAPLKSAMIQFLPADNVTGTAGATAIVEGRYEIPAAEGLVPGSYAVEVTSVWTA